MKTRAVLWLGLVLALSGIVPSDGQGVPQRVFTSPEAAADALVSALRDNNEAELLDIFGREHRDLVVHKDQAAAREYRTPTPRCGHGLAVAPEGRGQSRRAGQ